MGDQDFGACHIGRRTCRPGLGINAPVALGNQRRLQHRNIVGKRIICGHGNADHTTSLQP
jgi:hypothetical protein